MRRLHHILLTLSLATLLLTACSKDETVGPRPPVPETADQTIMFYLTGTSLGSNFKKNVDDAMSAIDRNLLHDSRVLVFIQPKRDLAMVLELYYTPNNEEYNPEQQLSHKNCKIDTLRLWTDTNLNSMDSRTVTEVLSYMAEQAPARQYGLILGGHGLGWVPDGISISAQRLSAFRDFWQPLPDALPTRWMGDSGKRAETQDLAAAIRNSGVHFEYLLFDVCLMSSIESMYDFRHCADNIIASPSEVLAEGFNYSDIMPHLLTNSGKNYDLNKVCYEYYNYHSNKKGTQSGCIALTITDQLEPLAAIIKRIETTSPQPYDPTQMQTYEGLSDHVFFDLQDYITAICSDPALLDEFNRQMEKTFPKESRLHTTWFYSGYGSGDGTTGGNYDHMYLIRSYSGVTTSAPCERFAPEWEQTAWYRATH